MQWQAGLPAAVGGVRDVVFAKEVGLDGSLQFATSHSGPSSFAMVFVIFGLE